MPSVVVPPPLAMCRRTTDHNPRRLALLILLTLSLGATLFPTSHAFMTQTLTGAVPPRTNRLPVSPMRKRTTNKSTIVALQATNDEEDTIDKTTAKPRPRRRRRRTPVENDKESPQAVGGSSEKVEEAPPLRPREDAPVALNVADVRSIVNNNGGDGPPKTAPASSTTVPSTRPSMESSSSISGMSSSPTSGSSTNVNDSLAQLLQDAQEMQAQETHSDGVVSKDAADEPSIPKLISSVLSTIVTVDFFVVCGFLLWFLAGIFFSYVLKDDGIQIAFNSNFEALVQPALGILMVAAIAGNFFKEDEES